MANDAFFIFQKKLFFFSSSFLVVVDLLFIHCVCVCFYRSLIMCFFHSVSFTSLPIFTIFIRIEFGARADFEGIQNIICMCVCVCIKTLSPLIKKANNDEMVGLGHSQGHRAKFNSFWFYISIIFSILLLTLSSYHSIHLLACLPAYFALLCCLVHLLSLFFYAQ